MGDGRFRRLRSDGQSCGQLHHQGRQRRRGRALWRRHHHPDAVSAAARHDAARLLRRQPDRHGGIARSGEADRHAAGAAENAPARRGERDAERFARRQDRRPRGADARGVRRTTMDATALRAMQAPIKDRYKSEPNSAMITLKARGTLDDTNIACKVETGRALAVAGLHPATGGSGMELCSGDMLLEALVACAGVTLKAVATALEFKLDGATVAAEGDLDFRGTLGVAKDAPVGFRAIRLAFDLKTNEPQERIDSLLKLTERYCVVFQTINQRPELSVTARAV